VNVEDKVIAITGAARGLGQTYATVLARAGAKIVVGDVNDCSETVDLVHAAGGECLGAKLDVTDESSAQALVRAAVERFGKLNAIVNNAALYGALTGGRFDQISETEWDTAMAVNVKGIWNCCKAAVPAFRQAGGGSIVNVTSLAALYGTAYALHYTTSKAAVIGLTRGLARELGRENIRVNAIAPSAVLTEGTKEFFAAKLDKLLSAVKAGQSIPRNLAPTDVAGTVLWLVSDASSFTTGQTIAVDGGTVFL
jgi:3-oxoacyl-[acyl-carrier protein] reductase